MLTPFTYDSHQIRVVAGDSGQSWFNAADVCAVLQFGNARQALESHVDADDVQKLDTIDSLGRTQRANHVNESGLYALILGSTKPEAKQFKRWVTSEVLPAIRKTGTYEKKPRALPHARTMQLIENTAALLMQIVPNLDRKILAVQTVETISRNTGVDVMPMQAAFGNVAQEVPLLTATQIGQEIGYSARGLNQWLEDHLYITRAANGQWITTPLGESLGGKMVPYEAANGHAGYRILWSKQAAHTLRELLEVNPR